MPRPADENAKKNEARKGKGRREQLGFPGAGGKVAVTCSVRRKSRHCRRGTEGKENREAPMRMRPAEGYWVGVHSEIAVTWTIAMFSPLKIKYALVCRKNSKGNEACEEQRRRRATGYRVWLVRSPEPGIHVFFQEPGVSGAGRGGSNPNA
jgi:hypothetical protein